MAFGCFNLWRLQIICRIKTYVRSPTAELLLISSILPAIAIFLAVRANERFVQIEDWGIYWRLLPVTSRSGMLLTAPSLRALRSSSLRLFAQRLTGVMAPTRILSPSLVHHSDL